MRRDVVVFRDVEREIISDRRAVIFLDEKPGIGIERLDIDFAKRLLLLLEFDRELLRLWSRSEKADRFLRDTFACFTSDLLDDRISVEGRDVFRQGMNRASGQKRCNQESRGHTRRKHRGIPPPDRCIGPLASGLPSARINCCVSKNTTFKRILSSTCAEPPTLRTIHASDMRR